MSPHIFLIPWYYFTCKSFPNYSQHSSQQNYILSPFFAIFHPASRKSFILLSLSYFNMAEGLSDVYWECNNSHKPYRIAPAFKRRASAQNLSKTGICIFRVTMMIVVASNITRYYAGRDRKNENWRKEPPCRIIRKITVVYQSTGIGNGGFFRL